jgi:hypothetical protein
MFMLEKNLGPDRLFVQFARYRTHLEIVIEKFLKGSFLDSFVRKKILFTDIAFL